MKDGQSLVKNYVEKRNFKNNYLSWYIDTINEYGELGRRLLQGNGYFNKDLEVTDEIKEHFGDMIAFANEMHVDMEECLAKALSKYEKKFNNQ